MPKTAIGLFQNPKLVDGVVREIEALGFPRQEVRTLEEPSTFEVTGVMSFPRLDYETGLVRELTKVGASKFEADAYVDGLRRGGALVFATGSSPGVDAAADVMNRGGAVEIEEIRGSEPHLTAAASQSATSGPSVAAQAGRIRQSGGGACFFVW